CRNCGDEKDHTILCHVIPGALEKIRLQGVDRDGRHQFLTVNKNNSLCTDIRLAGKFWCIECEKESATIDNDCVPLVRNIIESRFKEKKFSGIVEIDNADNRYGLLGDALTSIINRKMLYDGLPPVKKTQSKILIVFSNYKEEIIRHSVLLA